MRVRTWGEGEDMGANKRAWERGRGHGYMRVREWGRGQAMGRGHGDMRARTWRRGRGRAHVGEGEGIGMRERI